MPKMKTHRGAAKRFHVTGTGKIRRRRAFVNHILEKKAAKRKRRLRAPGATVSAADSKRVRRMLGE
jgi:large subunit ribosomal protein L35